VTPKYRAVTTSSYDTTARATAVLEEVDAVVCIERAGPCGDGACRTMTGRAMGGDVLAPQLTEALVARAAREPGRFRVRTLGIGDGGNEVGMGLVRPLVARHIPRGDAIACALGTDWLLAASVSNWGGYAVASALEVLERDRERGRNRAAGEGAGGASGAGGEGKDAGHGAGDGPRREAKDAADVDARVEARLRSPGGRLPSPRAHRRACVPTVEEVRLAIEACNAAGVRDGINGRVDGYVDGMPLVAQLALFRDLLKLAAIPLLRGTGAAAAAASAKRAHDKTEKRELERALAAASADSYLF